MLPAFSRGNMKRCYATHSNWVIVTLVAVVTQFSYSFTLPSMYQFLTSPSTAPAGKENSTFWPGLEEPEYFYSFAVSAFPIGEIIMSLFAAYLSTAIPYIITVPLSAIIAAMGGIMYALATCGEMVIVARFFLGSSNGMGLVVAQAYIGQTAKGINGKVSPSIEKMLFFYSICMTASLIASMGISAMVPLFVNVNPYRWGGWFVVASASLYTVSFLIVFQKKIDKSKSVCIPWVYRKRSSYCDRRLVLAKLLIVSSNLIQQ